MMPCDDCKELERDRDFWKELALTTAGSVIKLKNQRNEFIQCLNEVGSKYFDNKNETDEWKVRADRAETRVVELEQKCLEIEAQVQDMVDSASLANEHADKAQAVADRLRDEKSWLCTEIDRLKALDKTADVEPTLLYNR